MLLIYSRRGKWDLLLSVLLVFGQVERDIADGLRFGYQVVFLDRQIVLRTLFQRLEDPSKVVLNRRVVKVDHTETGVTVYCDGGEVYTGDVIIAADGVHSFIRTEMRRYADLENPKLMACDWNSQCHLPEELPR